MDKAPLLRQGSTPACLAELARHRSDIRTDGGAGANRLGVVGPLVEQLVGVLPVRCAQYRGEGVRPSALFVLFGTVEPRVTDVRRHLRRGSP